MNIYEMLLANAMGESGGGGGGGSSDFSTAQVTLNLTPPEGVEITSVRANLNFEYGGYWYTAYDCVATDNILSVLTHLNNANILLSTIEASDAEGTVYFIDTDSPINASGGITYDAEEEYFIITGDGTITATLIEGGR